MGLLFVRQTEIHFCSKDENCRTFQRQESANDILSAVETIRPDGVVFLGDLTPHPIELLCRLRTQGQLDAGRAAVIRSEEELRPRQRQTECWRHALWRFHSLYQTDEHAASEPGRRFFIDQRGRELSMSGKGVMFGPIEFRLLVFFLRYPGVVFSRQELLERTRCKELSVTPNMINVLVRRIRMKIELDLGSPHLLRTAHGLGYRFAYNGDVFFDQITGQRFVSWPCL
jgi:hypothetical protein